LYFSCKGKVISNKKIQLYVYNNISYKTVPIRNFRLMGKWKWDHFIIGSGRRGCYCLPGSNLFTEVYEIAPAGSRSVQIENV